MCSDLNPIFLIPQKCFVSMAQLKFQPRKMEADKDNGTDTRLREYAQIAHGLWEPEFKITKPMPIPEIVRLTLLH